MPLLLPGATEGAVVPTAMRFRDRIAQACPIITSPYEMRKPPINSGSPPCRGYASTRPQAVSLNATHLNSEITVPGNRGLFSRKPATINRIGYWKGIFPRGIRDG